MICAFIFADENCWFSHATAQVSFFPAGCNLQECGPKQYCSQPLGGTAECRCITNYQWDVAQEKCIYSPGKISNAFSTHFGFSRWVSRLAWLIDGIFQSVFRHTSIRLAKVERGTEVERSGGYQADLLFQQCGRN